MIEAWFEELSDSRAQWVESTRRNKFESGIRQSTVEKYPDPVHFVYELLQNAEDQGATQCRFILDSHGLVFEHNGKGFTREDVENITGLGNSDKPHQANKIGRFGIGFKSVFVVTDTPKIYTSLEGQPFAFQIQDLVVPRRIDANDKQFVEGQTKFVLPFMAVDRAGRIKRIAEKLAAIGSESLLFLSSVRAIIWHTETARGGYLVESTGERHKALRSDFQAHGSARYTSKSEYLMFRQNVELDEADRPVSVSIAFRAEEGQIVAEEHEQPIHVFFPTEERAGLRFRMHAPFLLTDNRANVKRGEPANKALVDATAALLVSALIVLRDEGRLSVAALGNLPIEPTASFDERTAELRGPLHEALKLAFRDEPLLPTDEGVYVQANRARLVRSDGLRSLLTGEKLSELYGSTESLHWLSSSITTDKTPELRRFLREELSIHELDPDGFASRISDPFLSEQEDAWMADFYTFLIRQEALWDRARAPLRGKAIVRLESGQNVIPFAADGRSPRAYLPPDWPTSFPTVRRSLSSQEGPNTFLRRLGLSEPDTLAEVLAEVVPRYAEPRTISADDWDRYPGDVAQIARAVAECPEPRKGDLRTRLQESSFVLAFNGADEALLEFRRPTDVFVYCGDTWTWHEGNPSVWFLHASLLDLPGWEQLEQFINGPKRVMVNRVRIFAERPNRADGHVHFGKDWGAHRRGLHGFYPSASIEGLPYALANMNEARARLLWATLLGFPELVRGTIESASHQNFDNVHKREEAYSTLGAACVEAAWLPNAAGESLAPSQIFLGELPEGFENDSPRSRALAQQLGMRSSKVQDVADQTGLTAEAAAFVLRNPSAIEDLAKAERKPNFPTHQVPDPHRREVKIAEEARESEPKTYEMRTRSVRTSLGHTAEDTDTYLRSLYTNDEGIMVCQACQQAMPFKRRADGEYYFVAIELLRDVSSELHQNHVALCPICAAKFGAARYTDDEELQDAVDRAQASTVPIVLAERRGDLRFVDTHLLDLQAALRVLLKTTDVISDSPNLEAAMEAP